ncbi:MAG: hypothetical protein Phog2KO_46180 [Phototrophicaceae bacterium]
MFSVWSASAQDCAFDVSTVINRVTEACADIEENEVCYGNRDVNATARVTTIDFVFENPGDRADLYNIQSLVVDAVGASEDTWGVAQMRLQIGSEAGVQDVNLLLFGRFDIENAVADGNDVALQARSFEIPFRRTPDVADEIFYRVQAGALLTGVGRLDDSTWLRVEDPVTRVVGWVENTGLQLVDESRSIGLLPIQEADTPYYGAMQAFYFENGTTDLGCDSIESDGLIIQTPEGSARISLLINEVSIELTGGEQAEEEGGTAFVQANPRSSDGMSVNVIEGSATVSTDTGSQTVQSGQQSTIPISVNLSPRGEPREAQDVDTGEVNITAFLPTVRNPFASDNQTATNNNSNGSTDIDIPTIPNNTDNGSSGDNANTGSPNINPVTGSSSDDSGNNTSQNSSSTTGTSSGDIDIDTSNPFENPSEDLPISIDPPIATNDDNNFITQGNIIALSIASVAAFILITFIVGYTRRNK